MRIVDDMFENPGRMLRTVYKIVFNILIVVAIIGWFVTIYLSFKTALRIDDIAPLKDIIIYPIIAVLAILALWLISLPVMALADISQNTENLRYIGNSNSAPTTEKSYYKQPYSAKQSGEDKEKWICPSCGSSNLKKNLYCTDCGVYHSEQKKTTSNQDIFSSSKTETDEGTWLCTYCGRKNKSNRDSCWDCGRNRY